MFRKFKNIYHLFVAIVAYIWYGRISRKLVIVGVTGTDGKTTTVSLIYHILKKAEFDVSMISTVGAILNGEAHDIGFHVTTPSSIALQRFIRKAIGIGGSWGTSESKNKYLILEMTSHALDQYRAFGLNFHISVLTNITNEHLDYHKTYQDYLTAKAKLLKQAKISIVNLDDSSYGYISKIIDQNPKINWITYGITKEADVNPQSFPFNTTLFGEFNTYNILAAISACKALGISEDKIREGIASFEPPVGREQIVHKEDFRVMIDFAHTPNSFEQILSEIRKLTKGRIIHVFGSAGERDRVKRPEMGKMSSKFSDIIVLTSEDSRSEDIEKINKEIEEGIDRKFAFESYNDYSNKKEDNKPIYFKINGRKEAITFAISIARKGDLVLLTGKGHEKSINNGQGEEPWSEHEAVKNAIAITRKK